MTATMSNQKEALEILNQLGKRAIMMMGVKQIVADWRVVTLKIGRNSKNVSHIRISLNVMDSYNVTFFNIRGITIKELNHLEDIYNDQLKSVIESNTGMYLSM